MVLAPNNYQFHLYHSVYGSSPAGSIRKLV